MKRYGRLRALLITCASIKRRKRAYFTRNSRHCELNATDSVIRAWKIGWIWMFEGCIGGWDVCGDTLRLIGSGSLYAGFGFFVKFVLLTPSRFSR